VERWGNAGVAILCGPLAGSGASLHSGHLVGARHLT
jgi:hypothetical protein